MNDKSCCNNLDTRPWSTSRMNENGHIETIYRNGDVEITDKDGNIKIVDKDGNLILEETYESRNERMSRELQNPDLYKK